MSGMNRKDRREEARRKQAEDQERKRKAAMAFAADIKKNGDYDPQKALTDPYYMKNVSNASKEKHARWEKNGITKADVDEAWKKGYRRCAHELAIRYETLAFAAVCIALHDVCGFGPKRIERVVTDMYRVVTEEITKEDLVERCARETGVVLSMNVLEETKLNDSLEANMAVEAGLEEMEI